MGYLAHLGVGQVRVLLDREPLDENRIASLSAGERDSLELLQTGLRYGQSLGLAPTTSYRHLLDRAPDEALQVAVASPPDRIEAVTWWFPIVGSMAYRSFFDPARAQRFSRKLEGDGLDIYVRSAALYSTLGYFDDPIPRTMLSWPDWAIIDTVLHELVHETVFVSGDSAYNESLATFIAHRATLAFFAEKPERVASAQRSFRDDQRFAELLHALRSDLQALYERSEDVEQAIRERGEVFARYQGALFEAQEWETQRYSGFKTRELSNAYVVAMQTYLGDLPCFEAEFEGVDNLAIFIAAHRDKPGRRPETCPSGGVSQ